jgi:uncharacterized protein (UPF0548 family)
MLVLFHAALFAHQWMVFVCFLRAVLLDTMQTWSTVNNCRVVVGIDKVDNIIFINPTIYPTFRTFFKVQIIFT